LPDLWTTHGWSVMRYSEYLLPIQNQPFVKNINPLIKPVITNNKKEVFVLPMDVDCAGIAFNKDVLDKAKVDPAKIKTWSDFKAACAKIKKIGKVPVYLGGSKDDWTVGNFFDWVAPTFTVTGTPSYGKQLVDGTFNWNNYKPAAQLFLDFTKLGYFNKNANEGTYNEVGEQLAKGNAAFAFFGNYVIGEAKKYNTKAHFGFMPLPSVKKGDPTTLISGERTAVGVWKDTEHKAEALKFLNYLAKPESVNLVAAGGLNPTGLVGPKYKTNAGDQTQYYNKYTKIKTYGYWDRAYLPSGMWDSLCKTGTGMMAGTMTIDQAIAKLKSDYDKLRLQ
jgi:raffinose/stachyose/melibiose transport system substrate-binding protein